LSSDNVNLDDDNVISGTTFQFGYDRWNERELLHPCWYRFLIVEITESGYSERRRLCVCLDESRGRSKVRRKSTGLIPGWFAIIAMSG